MENFIQMRIKYLFNHFFFSELSRESPCFMQANHFVKVIPVFYVGIGMIKSYDIET